MRKSFFGLAGAVILLSTAPASAACNATCQAKCHATAHLGGMTVGQCIAAWSRINAAYGSRAGNYTARFDRQTGKVVLRPR